MNYLGLFEGISGFGLAFKRVGANIVAVCEIDKTCQSVLRRHHPEAELIEDVKAITQDTFAGRTTPDVLAGGFPCQDLSVAGNRAGLDGDRSGLWFEMRRIAEIYCPRWIVIENVPGLLSSWSATEPPPCANEIRDFDSEDDAQRWGDSMAREWTVEESSDFKTVITGLTELGYCVAQRTFDSQFDGVAQRRERVFIVASFGNTRCLEVLLDEDSGYWDSPPRRGEGQGITGTLSAGTSAGGGLGTDFDLANGLQPIAGTIAASGVGTQRPAGQHNELDFLIPFGLTGNSHYSNSLATLRADGGDCGGGSEFLIAGTVSSKWAKGTGGPSGDECQNLVLAPTLRSSGDNHSGFTSGDGLVIEPQIAHTLRGEGFDASEDGTGRGTPLIAFDTRQNAVLTYGNQAPPLDTNGYSVAVAFTERSRPQGRTLEVQEDLAYSLTDASKGGNPHSGKIAGQFGVRRLTPTECERLQGFPDGHTAFGADDKPISDSQRYKQLGNAVCVNTATWIARRIVAADKESK